MQIQEIEKMWAEDSKIDRLDLGTTAISVPKLHSKYFRIFVAERIRLLSAKQAQDRLELEKTEFYLMGPGPNTPSDWKLPDFGRVMIKSDVARYVNADLDVQKGQLELALQKEKVNFLESIINQGLKDLGFAVRHLIDINRFEAGG